MNPVHRPGHEPDANDMSAPFDPASGVGAEAPPVPDAGEEEAAAALGDFA